MSWSVWRWLIAGLAFAVAALIVHRKTSEKIELGPHLARLVSIALVATAFYPLKEALDFARHLPFVPLVPIPVGVEIALAIVFLGAFVSYLLSVWNSSDDEGLSALRVPALALAVLLLLVGCGVLMWQQ